MGFRLCFDYFGSILDPFHFGVAWSSLEQFGTSWACFFFDFFENPESADVCPWLGLRALLAFRASGVIATGQEWLPPASSIWRERQWADSSPALSLYLLITKKALYRSRWPVKRLFFEPQRRLQQHRDWHHNGANELTSFFQNYPKNQKRTKKL